MKKHINDIYNLVEDWEVETIERLIVELGILKDEKEKYCACGTELCEYGKEIGFCQKCI
jgi:hypothetical protein